MPAKVTLKVIAGPNTGKVYVFEETAATIVGRAPGCRPQLPQDKFHRTISRHHCLLDINPPDIRVRDFGKPERHLCQ